ncbi:MAG: C39 family peptidase [Legionellaceae bacterium]
MINIKMQKQPTDESCGATCLQAIYDFYGLHLEVHDVIQEVDRSLSGGTLAPLLGVAALKRDFKSKIYINNLTEFDPTWFKHGKTGNDALIKHLEEQLLYKHDKGLHQVSNAFIKFLKLGGDVCYHTLDVPLIKRYFDQNIPLIVGLNATYLYDCSREVFSQEGGASFDAIRGEPCGHFVVLCGYDETHRHVLVADPNQNNPLTTGCYYKVSSHRLINAILLGVESYDAQILVVEKK